MRYGIIGCSDVAKRRFIPSLLESENSTLEIIGSRNEDKAREYAKMFGCEKSGSYEDVLNDKDVDAVYISLPISLHKEWIIKSAKAKKHIICEKSFTENSEDTKEALRVCETFGVFVIEGFMYRYHPQHRMVKEIFLKDIGIPHTFRAVFSMPRPKKNNIRLNKELGGGVLLDMGCYTINSARMIFGEEPIRVQSNLFSEVVDFKMDALLTFSGGKTALLSSSYDSYYQSSYEIIGTQGKITVKRAFSVDKTHRTKILFDRSDVVTEYTTPEADQFLLMIESFSNNIINNTNRLRLMEEIKKQAEAVDMVRNNA